MRYSFAGAFAFARFSIVLAAILAGSLRAPAQRLVFAHYMLTNQDYQADDDPTQERKIAAYEREIRQAQAIGIDGFALNAGGWLREPYYIRYAAQIFEAALRLHSGFRLIFSADMCCGNGVSDVEDMMRRFAGNPRYAPVYMRSHGAFVLTTFAGDRLGVAAWRQIRADLANGANPSTQREPTAFLGATGVPLGTPGYFHSHSAAADLLSYFIQWYKTGAESAITRDAIYYFYRTQPINADAGTPPVAHKYGPVADLLYITANLTAPAELRVTTGGQTKVPHLPAGSTDAQTPFCAGDAPSFALLRNGRTLISVKAIDPIRAAPKYNDFYYATGELTAP